MIGNPLPLGSALNIATASDDDLKAIVAFAANPLRWFYHKTQSLGSIEVDKDLLIAAIGELLRRNSLS